MEQLIASISILSTIVFAAAFISAIRIPRESMDRPSMIFLAASISIFMFNSFSNMLEYGGITDALEIYGHYVEILFDPLFMFFVYSYLSWQERGKTEKASAKLKESEARYHAVVDDQTEFISRYHPDGTITFVNKSLCQHTGKEYEELIGQNFLDMLHDEERAKIEQTLKTLDSENPVASLEHKFVRPETGEVFWQRWINRAIFDETGTIVEFQAVGRDVTIERKAEDELRESNTLLDNIYSSTNFLFAYLDRDFNFLNVNQAYADTGKKPRDYFIGKNHFDLYPHEENEGIFRGVVDTGKPFSITEKPFEHPDQPERGTTYWDWSLVPIKDESGTVQYLVFSLNDVTEKVNISKALRDSEERFRLAFENASIGSCIIGTDGRILKANEYLCGMLGYSEEELIGKTFNEFTHPDDVKLSTDQMKTMLADDGAKSFFEKRYIHKNGSHIWAMVSPSLLRDKDKNPLCFITYVQDITGRKLAEKKLKDNERWFRALFNDAPDAIMIADPETGYILNANAIAADLLGRPVEEIIGLHQSEIHPPKVKDYSKRTFREHVTEKKDVKPVENFMVRPDGTKIPVEVLGHTFEVGGKQIIMGIFRDVTERKKAEDALKESELKYRNLVESSLEGIALAKGNQVISANKAILDILGYDDYEEFLKIPISDHVAPESKEFIRERMEKRRKGEPLEPRFEYKAIRKDGQIIDIEISTTEISIGEELYIQSVFRDITERKIIEEKIIKSESQLRDAQKVAKLGFWDLNLETGDLFWSDEICISLKLKPQEIKPSYEMFASFVHPKDREFVQKNVDAAINDDVLYNIDFRYLLPSKEIVYVNAQGKVTRDENGKPVRFMGTMLDITERKKAEEDIRLHSEILGRLAEGVMMNRTSDGVIIYANPTFEQIFGYGPGALINRHVSVLNALGEKDPETVVEEIIHDLERFGMWAGEVQNVRADNTTFWSYASISAFNHHEYDSVWVTVQQDITDRKVAEMELDEHREKLAAMSMELSMTEERERRNIASDLHDHIAQALAITKVRLGEVGEQASGESAAKLESIKKEVDQIINNTRSLIFDLSPPVLYELGFKEAVEWLAEQVQKEHGIRVIVLAGKQYVQIDQEVRLILFKAVRELLMNVVKHAKATTIEVIITDLEENVHVQVKDDGVGFDVSKIHDYLTKASFGIMNLTERIKYIGGTVDFSSEPGQGTIVKIIAPMTLKKQEQGDM